MQTTNHTDTFQNPAHSGIFCFKTFLSAALLLVTVLCLSQPKLQVSDARRNFGFVKRGTLVKVDYEITNTGNQPLIITDAEVSCSCTTVEYPKQPVLPNERTTITISFNTATVYGRQDRVVYVNSNDPKGPAKLRYKGIVMNK